MRTLRVLREKGRLSAVKKGHKVFRIRQLIDFFRETSAWWKGGNEYDTFRVELDNGSICELEYDRNSGEWRVSQVFD